MTITSIVALCVFLKLEMDFIYILNASQSDADFFLPKY